MNTVILNSSIISLKEASNFFIKHTDTTYISHSEIQEGRAIDVNQWSVDLQTTLEKELNEALQNKPFENANLFGIVDEKNVLAIALVEYFSNDFKKYATLSDIVVSSDHREKGLACQLTQHICSSIQKEGYQMIFAESNINNYPAHEFLEKSGFKPISKVFLKKLI